jgi:NAD(P)-dependent dehydrogenase (short-subunit alcohol dehydrogenase family)
MNTKEVTVVTGAGKGIGRSIAWTYAIRGDTVIIAEKDPDRGKETASAIVKAGNSAIFIQCDVSKPDDIDRLFSRISEMYGTVNILINNAGISRFKSTWELTVDEWDEIINTNLRGIFLCSRAAAQIMRNSGGGSIVNIASTRAFMSEPGTEAYSASKGGIVALTHALAASFAPDHIRVNCISPGWIETGDYEKLRDIDHKQHLSGRVGKPEDIARACIYLTSGGNDFINGTNIIIDGGMTRKMIYEP